MINTEDAVSFIEKKYNTTLFDYQVRLLDNIIHGKVTDTPRNCGKTFIINGYAEYVNYLHDMCKYDSTIITNDYISGEEILKNTPSLLNIKHLRSAFAVNPDLARKEYNVEFSSVYLTNDSKPTNEGDK